MPTSTPAPISPQPVQGARNGELPAYVSNGLIGLRVRERPLQAGLTPVSGVAGEHVERRLEAAAPARGREVLQSLASGAPSKVIAHRLGISARTVEMHRANICEKLGVPTAAAIAIGCNAGLIHIYGEGAEPRPAI